MNDRSTDVEDPEQANLPIQSWSPSELQTAPTC